MSANLHLVLHFEYYDAIERGEKTEEYRLAEKWLKRLQGKKFDNIVLHRGYTKTRMVRPWRGYDLKVITHKHFFEGAKPVSVCAIRAGLDNL